MAIASTIPVAGGAIASQGSGRASPTGKSHDSFQAALATAEAALDERVDVGEAPSTSDVDVQLAKQQFRDWRNDYLQRGISADRRQQVLDSSLAFESLIDRAVASDAYDEPQAFLQSLSTDDLATLQRIHGLARAILPDGLGNEGALNLLQSPGHAQDIDHDGFQMVGLAKTWQFPPVDAPEHVKQAWQDATENLSDMDKLLLQGSFLPIVIEGVGSQSAYLGPNADYRALTQQRIDAAKLAQRFDEPWQTETRQRQIELLESFLERLAPV